MSSNQNRTRSRSAPEDPIPEPEETQVKPKALTAEHFQSTSSLNFVAPTEFVDLPSEGLFYPEGHPLHNANSVEIKYMTAKEEDILTSPSLIRSGKCLDRLLKSVLVDRNINPDNLLATDRNAILVAVRCTGYGTDYESYYSCNHCKSQSDAVFDLTEAETIRPTEETLKEHGVTIKNGIYEFMIPKLETVVGIKPIFHTDEQKVAAASKRKLDLGLPETVTTDLLRQLVYSVAGSTDRSLINQVVEHMPALDSRHIRKIYSLILPRINIENNVTCTSCGRESRLEVPFDTDFFWPKL